MTGRTRRCVSPPSTVSAVPVIDALRGDAALFTRDEAVEAAWRVVDPVLDLPGAVESYASGSWGPPSARTLMAGDGWHDPCAEGSAPC